jgi:hypothetical protein
LNDLPSSPSGGQLSNDGLSLGLRRFQVEFLRYRSKTPTQPAPCM